MIEFCKRFNEPTRANEELEPLRVKVCVYSDRSYDLILNAPTLACLVRRMLSLDRCASRPGRLQVGALTRANIALLAARKGNDMSAGVKCVVGSLRSMGISVER
ncbi:50S ribosomal subunit protein L11 [Candidatus Hodgkinia cicadicola]|nr:50S ribosomal subunit protein L11 [Candidatus Hodgkinia cicadicola]